MSDAPHSHEPNHEGPIKTPKQLAAAVFASFVIPILAIVLLVQYVTADKKPAAGTDALGAEAVALRIQPIGTVTIKEPGAVAVRTGEQVYQAVCTACHGNGVAGAPKTGDTAAWAARIGTGYEALLNSALKGKGAMGAQGGGEYSDYEIGRAVVYLANKGGATFPEPAAPAASAPADGASAPAN